MKIIGSVGLGIILSLLALTACGDRKPNGGSTTTSVGDATAAELARFQAEENARSQMTLVDASIGDAAAMPPEWTGPTVLDLGPKHGENRSTDANHAKAREAVAPPTEAAPVAQQDFPSVAE